MFVSFSPGICPSNTQASIWFLWLTGFSGFFCSQNETNETNQMNKNYGLISALLMLCLSWASAVWAVEEGDAIQKTIKEAAMAASTFPEARDKQAVLKLYTKDYVGI